MLKTPAAGWTSFVMTGYSCPASYLTDVPGSLLNCFISLLKNNHGYCYFDAEGRDYELFISADSAVIVEHENERKLVDITPADYDDEVIKKLALELCDDITHDLIEWSMWDTFGDEEETKVKREELRTLVIRLRELAERR